MDQQLSPTVGHGLSFWNRFKDIAYTVSIRTSQDSIFTTLSVRLILRWSKLLISLVIASWFVPPAEKISTITQQIHVLDEVKEIYERLRPGEPTKLGRQLNVACL